PRPAQNSAQERNFKKRKRGPCNNPRLRFGLVRVLLLIPRMMAALPSWEAQAPSRPGKKLARRGSPEWTPLRGARDRGERGQRLRILEILGRGQDVGRNDGVIVVLDAARDVIVVDAPVRVTALQQVRPELQAAGVGRA